MAAHTRTRRRNDAWAALAARRSFVDSDRGRILAEMGQQSVAGFPAGRTPEARTRCERGKAGRGAGLPLYLKRERERSRAARRPPSKSGADYRVTPTWVKAGPGRCQRQSENDASPNSKCRHHLAGKRSRCWLTAASPASSSSSSNPADGMQLAKPWCLHVAHTGDCVVCGPPRRLPGDRLTAARPPACGHTAP